MEKITITVVLVLALLIIVALLVSWTMALFSRRSDFFERERAYYWLTSTVTIILSLLGGALISDYIKTK